MLQEQDTFPYIHSTTHSIINKRQRSVNFHDEAIVYVLPAHEPLRQEERKELWYRAKDYKRFEHRDAQLIKLARLAGRTLDSEQHAQRQVDLRGLEHRITLRATVEARARRTRALRAVLGEQRLQRRFLIADPEKIRRASAIATRPSVAVALLVATTADEIAVQWKPTIDRAIDTHGNSSEKKALVPTRTREPCEDLTHLPPCIHQTTRVF
jgi:hypothetical protein